MSTFSATIIAQGEQLKKCMNNIEPLMESYLACTCSMRYRVNNPDFWFTSCPTHPNHK